MTAELVHVDGSPPYWRVDLVGDVAPEEFHRLAAAYRDQVDTWSRVLIDASGLANPSQVLALFVQERTAVPCTGDVRQAAVVNEASAGVARSWVRLVAAGSGGAQAFTSEASARTWLQEAVQSTTGGS